MFLTPFRKRNEDGNRTMFPLIGLRSEMDRLFDSFLREPFGSSSTQMWAPPVELSETENAFTVRAELPGIDPKDVEVSIVDNALVVSGEKKEKHEENDENQSFHVAETFYGAFRRTIVLPSEVDEKNV